MGDLAPAVPRAPLDREQRRSRRARGVRARTVSMRRTPKRDIALGRLIWPDDPGAPPKPRTRADCADVPRPCPYVSCAHHLYLDVSPTTGAIKLNFPDLEPDELEESCALDVAERGGTTLEEAGEIMNLTRERIRQLEVKAMAKILASPEGQKLAEYAVRGPDGRRHLPVLPADMTAVEAEEIELVAGEFLATGEHEP